MAGLDLEDLASGSWFWPRPRPRPQSFGLSLGLGVLALFNITGCVYVRRWYSGCVASNAVVNDVIKSASGRESARAVHLSELWWLWRLLLLSETALHALVAQRFRTQRLRIFAHEDCIQGTSKLLGLHFSRICDLSPARQGLMRVLGCWGMLAGRD